MSTASLLEASSHDTSHNCARNSLLPLPPVSGSPPSPHQHYMPAPPLPGKGTELFSAQHLSLYMRKLVLPPAEKEKISIYSREIQIHWSTENNVYYSLQVQVSRVSICPSSWITCVESGSVWFLAPQFQFLSNTLCWRWLRMALMLDCLCQPQADLIEFLTLNFSLAQSWLCWVFGE